MVSLNMPPQFRCLNSYFEYTGARVMGLLGRTKAGAVVAAQALQPIFKAPTPSRTGGKYTAREFPCRKKQCMENASYMFGESHVLSCNDIAFDHFG